MYDWDLVSDMLDELIDDGLFLYESQFCKFCGHFYSPLWCPNEIDIEHLFISQKVHLLSKHRKVTINYVYYFIGNMEGRASAA